MKNVFSVIFSEFVNSINTKTVIHVNTKLGVNYRLINTLR